MCSYQRREQPEAAREAEADHALSDPRLAAGIERTQSSLKVRSLEQGRFIETNGLVV